MTGLAQRAIAEEQMDSPDLDPATYGRALAGLAQVNKVTLARRPTLGFLGRAVGGRKRFSLLDVGFGQGDMLRAIARWAERSGVAAELTGIDLHPLSKPAAEAATPAGMPIRYLTGDYAGLGDFDCIVSSLVAHHMTRNELVAFLRHMEAHARAGWFVNDLHRHRLAYLGFPLLARIMRWPRIVREDGTLSIARAYRPAEWPPILAEAEIPDGAARVFRAFPFRLCVERLR